MVIIHYSSSSYVCMPHCFPASVTYLNAVPKRGQSHPHGAEIYIVTGHSPEKKKRKLVGGPCSLDLLIVFNFQQDYSCITVRCWEHSLLNQHFWSYQQTVHMFKLSHMTSVRKREDFFFFLTTKLVLKNQDRVMKVQHTCNERKERETRPLCSGEEVVTPQCTKKFGCFH